MKWLTVIITLGLLSLVTARDPEDGKLIIARSTKTAIVITSITTVRPLTCYLAFQGDVCQRRRFRRYHIDKGLQLGGVDGSLDDNDSNLTELDDSEGSNRIPRVAAKLIFTTSTTYTMTVTSTNRAVTFSLSYFCTVAGSPLVPACG